MTNRKPLVHAIVHNNGTSAEELQNLRLNVINALRRVQVNLAEMAPNGRDYYLQPGLLEHAIAQHNERVRTVCILIGDLNDEVVRLGEAGR